MPCAKMLGRCSDVGPVVRKTQILESSDPREVVAFVKKAGKTAGFQIVYGVSPAKGEVVELFTEGYLNQGDLKPWLAAGFTEWHFSWAWASEKWEVYGQAVQARKSSKIRGVTLAAWGRALGII